MYLLEAEIQCPYCWENSTILIEPLEERQSYVEDCQVCCAPLLIHVHVMAGEVLNLDVERENA